MKTLSQMQAEQQADEVIRTMASIKESLDRLIELFENPPGEEPPGWGDVI